MTPPPGGLLPPGGGGRRPPGPLDLRAPNDPADLTIIRPLPIISVGGDPVVLPGGLGAPSGAEALAALGGQPPPDHFQVPPAMRASTALALPDDLTLVSLPTAAQALLAGAQMVLGAPWLAYTASLFDIASVSSYRGFNVKYPENQDRITYGMLADGSFAMVAVDGMGGHAGGEPAAEAGRHGIEQTWLAGGTLGESIDMANEVMVERNVQTGQQGAAVAAGFRVDLTTRDFEARSVGDSEVYLISFARGGDGTARMDYWSTRPSDLQAMNLPLSLLPDGRVAWGDERMLRMDPDSNIVTSGLGFDSGPVQQNADHVALEEGRIYIALTATDGFTEQFESNQEILDLVAYHVQTTGDMSPEGIRNFLQSEAMLRGFLSEQSYLSGGPMEITPEVFREAYRAMTNELYGSPSDPPPGYTWTFQSHTGAGGEDVHYWVLPGSGYVVRGVTTADGRRIPDPTAVDPDTGQLRPGVSDSSHPSLVGRFKQDNVSLGVAQFWL